MEKIIEEQIEKIVEIVYSLDKVDFEKEFVVFLDLIEKSNNMGNIKGALINLQEAYIKKDYIEFADVLLYEIKPSIRKN